MPEMGAGGLGTNATGFPYLVVRVDSVDRSTNSASVTDSFGKLRDIPIDVRRGGAVLPQEGENWVIDRSLLSTWTFAARIGNDTAPVVVGYINDGSALRNLLIALDALGIISNQTEDAFPDSNYLSLYADTY